MAVTATNDHAGELLSLTVYEDGTSLGFVRRFNFGPTFALSESTITVGGEPVRLLTIELVGGEGIASSMVGANNVDLIRCPTSAAVTTALLKFDADEVLQVGDVGDVGDCAGVDVRADTLIRAYIAGDEQFALTDSTLTWASTVAAPTYTQAQGAGAGASMQIAPQQGAAGQRGGHLLLSGGEPGTPNDSKWGHVDIDLGDPDTSDDDKTASLIIRSNAAGVLAELYSDDVPSFAVKLDTSGPLTINGAPHARTVIEIDDTDSPYTLTDTNCIVLADATANDVTITIPAAAGVNAASSIEIIHTAGGNSVELAGAYSASLGFAGDAAVLRSAGGAWRRVAGWVGP